MELVCEGEASLVSCGPGKWRIAGGRPGPSVLILDAPRFVIGRSEECDLVLPDSEALRATTSRWHCHIVARDGELWLADGAPRSNPRAAGKPSVSGTFLNGARLSEPRPLGDGDLLAVGPWRLRARAAAPARSLEDEILRELAASVPRSVEASHPKAQEKFGQLHELVRDLARTPGIEESLTALLSHATRAIGAAEVAAVLLEGPRGDFEVRLAWDKRAGRMGDFRFSSSLLKSLPPERSFLLESSLAAPTRSQTAQGISSGLLLPLWSKGRRQGVFYLDNRRTGRSFTEEDLYLGSALASVASLQLALDEQSRLRAVGENMARYFAPDVVQRILLQSAEGRPVGLEVQERDVTVLFVDMEGFTAMSRTRTPLEVGLVLNPYLETVARAVQAQGGHVNKFIGDAVMGIFGAQPTEASPDPARDAVEAVAAALDIPRAWRREAERRGLPALRLRVGVNSGRAIVGNVGYPERLEYTVLGDAVNVAARLEKLAAPDRAAVSARTRELARDAFEFEDLGEREVKGVGALRVWAPTKPLP